MTRLDTALEGVGKLGIDTSAFIYLIESNPRYEALLAQLFERILRGQPAGAASVLVLTEVLVHPLRQGALQYERQYREILVANEHIDLIAIDAGVASRAAELRARHGIRTPDALHVATALEAGCDAFLTNDRRLERIDDLSVLLLDELQP